MTMPVEEITVTCPDCGHVYKDWYRGSINLALDDFDADYLEQASTTTCHTVKPLRVTPAEPGVYL